MKRKNKPGEWKNKTEKEERKRSGKVSNFDDMIAYVDENGMITSTPPENNCKKKEIDQEEIRISTPKKEAQAVLKGRIEHLNTSKGYGFIKDLSGTDKYFFM